MDLQGRAALVAVLGDLAGRLDAREAGTADDDLSGIVLRRVSGGAGDGVVDVQGVVQRLERVCVLLQPLDTEEGGLRTDRDEEVVVVDGRCVVQFDDALLGVDVGDRRLHEVGLSRLDVADGDSHLLLDGRVTDTAVRFVEYQMVVGVRDPSDVGLAVQFVFEALYRTRAGVASSENDNVVGHV